MSHSAPACSAEEAKKLLVEGNKKYVSSRAASVDASEEVLKECTKGQTPYAIVVSCSDSRVIPEAIFSAGIGGIFVIRVAGNVIDSHQLGSIEYASGHLGTRLVLVLGHESCGAVGAALTSDPDGYTKTITDEIKKAVGNEKDPMKACQLNVQNSVKVIKDKLHLSDDDDLKVIGGVYHIGTGEVEFL